MIFQSPSTAPVDTASDSITVDAWIMVALTALTFLFALGSWWSSNKSKKAREAAETAEKNANRRVKAAESTATELRKLVEQLSLPPLVATATRPRHTTKIRLQNTTGEEIILISCENQSDFYSFNPESSLPHKLPCGAQFSIAALSSSNKPIPSNLHLRAFLYGEERTLHVPIPHVN